MSTEQRIVDKYYYVAEDAISHMAVANLQSLGAHAVIAVQDKIRVIDNRGQVKYQSQLDSQVTAFDLRSEPSKSGCPILIYGTKNGNLGAIELTPDEAIVLWETDFNISSGISLLKVARLSQTGNDHAIVSRDDGTLEVYEYSQYSAAESVYQTKETEE